MPKYCKIWYINKVLKFYEEKTGHTELNLKVITKIIFMLMMCTSAQVNKCISVQRKQALLSFQRDNVILKFEKMIALPNKTLKHTKPGRSTNHFS